MNLESMLSARSQTHKAKYWTIPCTRNVKNRQIHMTARAGGRRKRGVIANGFEVFLSVSDENVLESGSVDDSTTLNTLKIPK